MVSIEMRRLIASFAFLVPALLMALPASAGQFNVKPIRIYLSKDATSSILTIENQGQTPLRLQVGGFAWRNDAQGQLQLTPSDDLIVFPALITVLPSEQRNIRIGFTGSPAAKEQAYRITLDELPSIESQLSQAKAASLEVRTRITVPVFFAPTSVEQKGGVDELALRHGAVHAVFTNVGTVHAVVDTVDITARDENGAVVADKQIRGWYVLPGERRDFSAALSPSQCTRVRKLSVSIDTDIGHFTREESASGGGCTR